MLQAHIRDFMERPQDVWVCAQSNEGKGIPTRKPDRGNEKKKASVVQPYHSSKAWPKWCCSKNAEDGRSVGLTMKEWTNEMGSGHTRLGSAVTQCVHHVSPYDCLVKRLIWSDLILILCLCLRCISFFIQCVECSVFFVCFFYHLFHWLCSCDLYPELSQDLQCPVYDEG